MRKRLRIGLAVAVWAAGTWGLHALLPVVPMVEWPVPDGCRVEAVTPDGIAVIVHGPPFEEVLGAVLTGPVEGWDIRTGKRLWSVLGPDDATMLRLENGQIVVHHYKHAVGFETGASERLDARSGRVIEQWRFPALIFDGFISLLPDHRTAFEYQENRGKFCLIEAATGRVLQTFPVGRERVSANGRFVAIEADDTPPISTGIWELSTGRLVGRCPTQCNAFHPSTGDLLSADGRLLIDREHSLWDVPTGRVRFKTSDPITDAGYAYQSYLSADGRWMILHRFVPDIGCVLCWLDIESGREDVSRRLVLLAGTDDWAATERAPDRRLTCLVQSERPAGWLEKKLAGLHPSLAPFAQDHVKHWRVIVDPETARVVARYPGDDPYLGLTADGAGVITGGPTVPRVRVWDIPPRKSLRWLVGLSAGWGVLVGLVARMGGRWAGRRG